MLLLQRVTVERVLSKYRQLPALLSHHGDLSRHFVRTATERETAVEVVRSIRDLSGAADVGFALMDGEWVARAADVLNTLPTLDGALLNAAREGRLGRLSLPGRPAGLPSYAFSYPVRSRDGTRLVGTVVIVVGLEPIAEAWSTALDAIWLTDADGRFVVANDFARLPATTRQTVVSSPLYRTGWTLHVGVRSDRPSLAFRDTLIGSALAFAFVLLAVALAVWRWRAQRTALRTERAQALRLERRVRDRTRDLKNANERLQAAQDDLVQSAKLAALGRMSTAFAHEYNQPLAAVRAYATNAAKWIERSQPERAVEALERIDAMAVRMADLSKSLRSFARKPGQDIAPVDLAGVIGEAKPLVELQARRRGIAIDWPPLTRGPTVMGGPVRLSQVLVNLIGNAVEAAGRNVSVAVEEADGLVVLRVSDDGPGVDPAHASQIFDPFFTTRPAGQGLGLGLAIAYNIVRDFGGSLRLVDRGRKGGSGATFQVELRSAPMERAALRRPEMADA